MAESGSIGLGGRFLNLYITDEIRNLDLPKLKNVYRYLLKTTPRHSVNETILLLMMMMILLLASEFKEVKQETNKQQDENKKTRKIDGECHYIFDFYSLKVFRVLLLLL